ncbi:unnamed protein product [Clonostachys solani]|uniref:AB hydrolase-1 domain-containing protein n=1 Tax=Clonostachys solani TaxID=160281 RepID=A0A9N9Z9W2_9HYPO|nr:unnamed protein product [Clonostachys solani]
MADLELIPNPADLPPLTLPEGIKSRFVDTSPIGPKFHVLESIPTNPVTGAFTPLILLIHGFPNLAYDWIHVMPSLAKAGYYVVAFDQRGFGRTHRADLKPFPEESFRPLTLARDVTALVHALGYESVHTLVGHDLGAATASIFTLTRSDVVKSLVLLDHPFGGPPALPFGNQKASGVKLPPYSLSKDTSIVKDPDIHSSLLKFNPPRQLYKWYNTSPAAADEWSFPAGEPLHEFLRGYFHLKSADHRGNQPRRLKSWTADELAVMPHYYTMRAGHSMRENVALDMAKEPSAIRDNLPKTPWLPDEELAVYTAEWSRTSFKDALRWYKVFTDPDLAQELTVFAGKRLAVPTKHVGGAKDWGNYQVPGALEAMENEKSVEAGLYKGTVIVEGAGHWVNLEKPDDCVREILSLANSVLED